MARPRKLVLPSDPMLLQAMVDGLELQKQRLDAQIAAVKAAMGGTRAAKAVAAAPVAAVTAPAAPAKKAAKKASGEKPKRVLSQAAREAIAAAQRKRWAKFRKDEKG